jgi:hypothetical protein
MVHCMVLHGCPCDRALSQLNLHGCSLVALELSWVARQWLIAHGLMVARRSCMIVFLLFKLLRVIVRTFIPASWRTVGVKFALASLAYAAGLCY